MLTRRHIRAKVMQSIYAMQQSQSQDLDKEIKFLQNSASQTLNLYLLLCNLLTQLHDLSLHQEEITQKKYLSTSDDKKLHQRFSHNTLLLLIKHNSTLQNAIKELQMNQFDIDDEYVRTIYKNILDSQIYKNYIIQDTSFDADKNFLIKIFEEIIATDEHLYDYIEDNSLTWLDDFPIINTYIVKLLKSLKADTPEKYLLPQLYKNEDEKKFLIDLFKKTVLQDAKLNQYVENKLTNWDKERVAIIDNILLKMATAEFLYFPSIPIKVTINEYLELAKEYSTAKSNVFINGVLNVILKELQEKQLIKKIGKGLL